MLLQDSIGEQSLMTHSLRIFSFSELKTSTNNFGKDRLLGEGGFGKVYKGWLAEKNGSSSAFAVKRYDAGRLQGLKEWKSYNAKMTDFGLARLVPSVNETHVTTSVVGTYGYAAPEYVATGHLNIKSDVYGYGVVLVEMLTGLRAIDRNHPSAQHMLVGWVKPYLSQKRKLVKIMDSRLEGKYPSKAAFQIAQLALKCLGTDPKTRPSMTEVVETLEHVDASNE
ncbi:hypothetical protein Vadar_002888 [Vaccinium darrowii]|uniref:Uncharacterized protein n=1 Tax=Vaccinium darrowii TaxID=229202 RepID=A0ACB7XXQ2_9ERIC|nr:hypothetical protein Vadar_002888 [Vaccinium darrowii]